MPEQTVFTQEFIADQLKEANSNFLKLKLQERFMGNQYAGAKSGRTNYESILRDITRNLTEQEEWIAFLRNLDKTL